MRPIHAAVFASLDGVMQAPGGPDEDPTGGFRFGGWTVPYWHDSLGHVMGETFAEPFDLLLGRRTYDIFAAHWPQSEDDIGTAFNAARKYVATHDALTLTWANSESLGDDVIARLKELKRTDGPRLLVQGSTELLHQLFAAGLVDRLQVLLYPVLLGRGKRLFGGDAQPAELTLESSLVAPNGVILARYVRRDGDIRTGSFAHEEPSPAELERRRTLA